MLNLNDHESNNEDDYHIINYNFIFNAKLFYKHIIFIILN